MTWLLAIAVALILLGLILQSHGKSRRRSQGLTDARTLDLDTRTLYSRELALAGRPDRLFPDGRATIPEEWKSAKKVYDSHKAQLGTYFILIEQETGIAPPYGVIVLGDGTRVKVRNTPELRAWVLAIAEDVRAAKRDLEREIPVKQPPAKCRKCGMREGCGQRSG